MKKVTKTILGLTTLSILSTSAFAYSSQSKVKGCGFEHNKSHKMMKMKHHKKNDNIIKIFMQLELTTEQKDKIVAIIKESKLLSDKPTKAFSASEFDKEMFVKLIKEQREARIERKANMIEKAYAVLTKDQKIKLKTLLDKKGGIGCDKNCNGRG